MLRGHPDTPTINFSWIEYYPLLGCRLCLIVYIVVSCDIMLFISFILEKQQLFLLFFASIDPSFLGHHDIPPTSDSFFGWFWRHKNPGAKKMVCWYLEDNRPIMVVPYKVMFISTLSAVPIDHSVCRLIRFDNYLILIFQSWIYAPL